MRFAALDRDKTVCRACGLWRQGGSVLCVGNRCRPLMLVVGDAPDALDVVWRKPFACPAGSILRSAIHEAGFQNNEVLYSNLLGCHPPGNVFPEDRQQVQYCIDNHLMREIELSQPVVILLVGEKPLFYIHGITGIARGRGEWRPGPFDIPTMATYHPSYILRGAGHEVEEGFKKDICDAYQRATTGTA